MKNQPDEKETLGSLLSDVKEHLIYLNELGVENAGITLREIETAPSEDPRTVTRPPSAPKSESFSRQPARQSRVEPPDTKDNLALMRNALSATSLSDKKAPAKPSPVVVEKPVSTYNKETIRPEDRPQRTMPKKEKVNSEPVMPGDSLFGDIAPTNELPPSNETLE